MQGVKKFQIQLSCVNRNFKVMYNFANFTIVINKLIKQYERMNVQKVIGRTI